MAISDVTVDDDIDPGQPAQAGQRVGCTSGALTHRNAAGSR
jgi:hypothetical protein